MRFFLNITNYCLIINNSGLKYKERACLIIKCVKCEESENMDWLEQSCCPSIFIYPQYQLFSNQPSIYFAHC